MPPFISAPGTTETAAQHGTRTTVTRTTHPNVQRPPWRCDSCVRHCNSPPRIAFIIVVKVSSPHRALRQKKRACTYPWHHSYTSSLHASCSTSPLPDGIQWRNDARARHHNPVDLVLHSGLPSHGGIRATLAQPRAPVRASITPIIRPMGSTGVVHSAVPVPHVCQVPASRRGRPITSILAEIDNAKPRVYAVPQERRPGTFFDAVSGLMLLHHVYDH